MTRYQATTPVLDQAERDWWAEHGELEERFCWVQTPLVQRLLRGAYLRRVLAHVKAGDTVLEIGCGTGWLSLLLARMGAGEVVGLDFSGEQIERARAAAAASPTGHRVRFVEGDLGGLASEGVGPFNMVVLHAFLHHLSTREIDEVLDGAVRLVQPGGRLVVVEPVVDVRPTPGSPAGERRLRWLRVLAAAPMALQRRGLRRVDESEAAARRRLGSRNRAEAPCGPSPKEHPFVPGELEVLLGERVSLELVEPCLGTSVLVAQEVLLARLSQPRLWGAALAPILWVARALDRRMLAVDPKPAHIWVFYLYIATTSLEPLSSGPAS
jgi:2-polyprenyl-3-methyl-5-hydroxy-6-metoxy-1,4-benzoquinol methylase